MSIIFVLHNYSQVHSTPISGPTTPVYHSAPATMPGPNDAAKDVTKVFSNQSKPQWSTSAS